MLDDAYDASVGATPATSLRDKLREYESSALSAIAEGKTVVSVSTQNAVGGRSTSFSQLAAEGFNPVSLAETWRSLIDLFDEVEADLGGTPTDDEIKDEMMGLLKPCTEVSADFTLLRTGRVLA